MNSSSSTLNEEQNNPNNFNQALPPKQNLDHYFRSCVMRCGHHQVSVPQMDS